MQDKRSGSCIFPDPDPGDPKRPDPTGSGSATLVETVSVIFISKNQSIGMEVWLNMNKLLHIKSLFFLPYK